MTEILRDVDAVVGDHTGRSRLVLEFALEVKRLVDRAKEPGFDEGSWEPLAHFVDVDTFERIGPFKDRMTWPEYVSFLSDWAPTSHWECSFRGITEVGDRVFLQLEERIEPGDSTNAVNTLSAYQFGADNRLHHLAVYIQMPPRAAST